MRQSVVYKRHNCQPIKAGIILATLRCCNIPNLVEVGFQVDPFDRELSERRLESTTLILRARRIHVHLAAQELRSTGETCRICMCAGGFLEVWD